MNRSQIHHIVKKNKHLSFLTVYLSGNFLGYTKFVHWTLLLTFHDFPRMCAVWIQNNYCLNPLKDRSFKELKLCLRT